MQNPTRFSESNPFFVMHAAYGVNASWLFGTDCTACRPAVCGRAHMPGGDLLPPCGGYLRMTGHGDGAIRSFLPRERATLRSILVAAVTGPRTKDQLILLDDQYGCITRIAHPLAREAAFEDSCSCFSHRRLRCRAAQITFRLFILEEEKYAWPPMHWLGLGVVLQNCTWFSVLGRGDHRATRRLRVCGCIEFCAYTVNIPFRV